MTGPLPAAAVTYVGLPISSGGAHSLGRMSRRAAYEQTMTFLRTCTEPVSNMEYRFRLNEKTAVGLPSDPMLWLKVKARFGPGAIGTDRVSDALDFLDEIEPQPESYGVTPIWFWATTRFRILDPATGMPFPGQDPKSFGGTEYEWQIPLGSSDLRLILHNRAALGVDLCIPNADRDVLRRVVPWLQEHLPFKLSAKHWRAWNRTRSGSFRARKLAVPG